MQAPGNRQARHSHGWKNIFIKKKGDAIEARIQVSILYTIFGIHENSQFSVKRLIFRRKAGNWRGSLHIRGWCWAPSFQWHLRRERKNTLVHSLDFLSEPLSLSRFVFFLKSYAVPTASRTLNPPSPHLVLYRKGFFKSYIHDPFLGDGSKYHAIQLFLHVPFLSRLYC